MEFFPTSKFKRSNHFLKATSRSEFLLLIYSICFSVSRAKGLKNCLQFAQFNFTEKVKNVIKKYGVTVKKSLSENRIFGNKNLADTILIFSYVKVATVQKFARKEVNSL